jgi:hypothetical protein
MLVKNTNNGEKNSGYTKVNFKTVRHFLKPQRPNDTYEAQRLAENR